MSVIILMTLACSDLKVTIIAESFGLLKRVDFGKLVHELSLGIEMVNILLMELSESIRLEAMEESIPLLSLVSVVVVQPFVSIVAYQRNYSFTYY